MNITIKEEIERLKELANLPTFYEIEKFPKDLNKEQFGFENYKAGSVIASRRVLDLIKKLEKVIEIQEKSLLFISEYWNGESDSAVDAAEENRDEAAKVLNEVNQII